MNNLIAFGTVTRSSLCVLACSQTTKFSFFEAKCIKATKARNRYTYTTYVDNTLKQNVHNILQVCSSFFSSFFVCLTTLLHEIASLISWCGWFITAERNPSSPLIETLKITLFAQITFRAWVRTLLRWQEMMNHAELQGEIQSVS